MSTSLEQYPLETLSDAQLVQQAKEHLAVSMSGFGDTSSECTRALDQIYAELLHRGKGRLYDIARDALLRTRIPAQALQPERPTGGWLRGLTAGVADITDEGD